MPEHHHNILEAQEQSFKHQTIENEVAPNISYFTPLQRLPAGIASDPPKVFQRLKLRGLSLQKRIMVRLLRSFNLGIPKSESLQLFPLCQYSAEDGGHSAWHFANLGVMIGSGGRVSIPGVCRDRDLEAEIC